VILHLIPVGPWLLWNLGLIPFLKLRVPLHTITQDAVLEHYVLTRAIDNCYGPKYETYKAKSSRLQTFVIHDWPFIMDLPPNDLSEAGFFFTGRRQYFSETFVTIFIYIRLYLFF
jgi:hypothetical protein